jgi:hypothetical protein
MAASSPSYSRPEQPDITVGDVVIAAQTNDLDKLRRCIDLELADNRKNVSRPTLQAACHAAARHNHPAALHMLLDSGCIIDGDKYFLVLVSL